jgi:hypothetical protein
VAAAAAASAAGAAEASAIRLNTFWDSAPTGHRTFQPDRLADLPEGASRYLQHAVAPGSRLAAAVRLRMHGEIKIKRWSRFTAEQVIRWDRGMIWQATARVSGLPISGSDRLVDGDGAMRWKLLGLFPVTSAAGADINRSAVGRLAAESIWLPSFLCRTDVSWTQPAPWQPTAHFTLWGEGADLRLEIDAAGRLAHLSLPRWGNPDRGGFHYADFGAVVEAEGTFGGYTIPTRLRAGWHFGSGRFESEGEFFRVIVDAAAYR